MSKFRKIICVCVMAAMLVMAFPVSSIAVDPVSAATMANAFAQAITAYGASQGVSMTFDVANTDGIGEGVHDLWEQYADDMAQSNVTVSDYSNLAASVFPTLWKKTFDYVTVSLDAATVGEIDGFWNWLLSGPAEMTKVDNQYYEWNLNQNNTVDPILIYSTYAISDGVLPYISNPSKTSLRASGLLVGSDGTTSNTVYCGSTDSSRDVCVFVYYSGSNPTTCFVSATQNSPFSAVIFNTYVTDTCSSNYNSSLYYKSRGTYDSSYSWDVPVFTTQAEGFAAFSDYLAGDYDSGISVQPYVGDTAPQNVYIPDNTDVNYTPVAAEIPLDIPWNDELYGDGTGALTDAQSDAITKAADDAITDNPDKTLELADTTNPPAPSPSEVYIPFLPVTLPSFQFSLSGIWHYVTAWVASLGAWFSLVFTTWSYLPYAISVPVYATAVIVIVLGVYKRFFM